MPFIKEYKNLTLASYKDRETWLERKSVYDCFSCISLEYMNILIVIKKYKC